MTNIHETAYPILPAEPSAAELKASFTPTTAEMRFVRRQSRQESTAVLIMVQLKLLQRLGYFPCCRMCPTSSLTISAPHFGFVPCLEPGYRATIGLALGRVTRSCCAPMSTSGNSMPARLNG